MNDDSPSEPAHGVQPETTDMRQLSARCLRPGWIDDVGEGSEIDRRSGVVSPCSIRGSEK